MLCVTSLHRKPAVLILCKRAVFHGPLLTRYVSANQRGNGTMSQTLKVTMNKIEFDRAGDDGKGETYWSLMVDGQVIDSRSRSNARKTKNGEAVVIGQSGTVTKGDNQTV